MMPTIVQVLDALGVPYDVVDCDPTLADTAAFTEHYGFPLEASANTIIVASRRGPQRYGAAVVLATTRLDVNRTMKQLLGVGKASFATADETRDLTGMEIGGVTAIGLPPTLPLFVDRRVMDREWIILGGGDRSSKLRITPQVFDRLDGVEIVEGLAHPISAAG